MTIRRKLGVTLILKFNIFLIEPIFCLQYFLYISWATFIEVLLLHLVRYIHGYMKLKPKYEGTNYQKQSERNIREVLP